MKKKLLQRRFTTDGTLNPPFIGGGLSQEGAITQADLSHENG